MTLDPQTPNWRRIDVEQSPHWLPNLEELQKRDAALAQRVESSLSQLEQLEICEPELGQFRCRWAQTKCEVYPAGPLLPQLESQLDRAKIFYNRGVKLLLVVGSGIGYLASHIEPVIQGQFQCGLLLIEPRIELFIAHLCLFEARHLLRSYQVFFAVGESMLSSVEPVMRRNALHHVSNEQIALLQERQLTDAENQEVRELRSALPNWWRRAVEQIQDAQGAFNQRMQQPPNLEAGVAWAFAAPDAYAHTPLMESLLGGFGALGWRKSVIQIRDGFQTRARVGEDVINQQPDILFFCNSASKEFVSYEVTRPRVTIMLDNPEHYSPESLRENLGPMDHVFYIDRTYGPFFDKTHAATANFMPAFSMGTQPGRKRDELAASIVFVGSYTPVSDYLKDVKSSLREQIEAIAQRKIDHPLENAPQAIQASGVSEEAAAALQQQSLEYIKTIQRNFATHEMVLDYYLYALSNSLKRERCIEVLLDLGVVVYGPESWLKVLGQDRADQFRGWLPGDQLPDVYASAKICLNLHSLQCPTCFNPRDFDILAAGGCLLGDEIADMEEGILEREKDLCSFSSPQQLREVAQELLENKEKRLGLVANGKTTIAQRHTPAHRAQTIVETIRNCRT
ncbi:MAG: glycosyltransferase [Candidatus Hinthialibacter antarcticus]|nr:glycosyltransferase [Candidatus Hinthialibacter antarcticus]